MTKKNKYNLISFIIFYILYFVVALCFFSPLENQYSIMKSFAVGLTLAFITSILNDILIELRIANGEPLPFTPDKKNVVITKEELERIQAQAAKLEGFRKKDNHSYAKQTLDNLNENPLIECKTFQFTPEQQIKYEVWYKNLPKVSYGTVGGGYHFIFTPTGIGCGVVVKRDDGEEVDLTEEFT